MHNVMTKYGYGNLEIIQMQYGMQEGKMKKRLASIVLATVTMLTACGGNTSTAWNGHSGRKITDSRTDIRKKE